MKSPPPRRAPRSSVVLIALAALVPSALVGCPVKTAKATIEVAITVDDLPGPGPGQQSSGQSPIAVARAMIKAFRKHRVSPVTGFVNGRFLRGSADGVQALRDWIEAGHRLGNHTYSHLSASRVPLADYLNDIAQNEEILQTIVGEPDSQATWRVFRYPFLQEGPTPEMREGIRKHLSSHGYQIAEVTVDFGDWAWNNPYVRCFSQKNQKAIDALKKSYLENAIFFLQWAATAGREAFQQPVRQILLLHATDFNAQVVDDLLTAYEKEGVQFVALERALKDAAYGFDHGIATKIGASFLEQVIKAKRLPHPPSPPPPMALLSVLCKEQ